MKPTMYGIPNCDTIKNAKAWLEAHNIEFDFHNYKKDGVDEASLQSWVTEVSWQKLLNQRGTTWRKLSDEEKSGITNDKAAKLMCMYPSMIKRPVLQTKQGIIVGFDADTYALARDSGAL